MNKRLGTLARGFSALQRHGALITIAAGMLVIAVVLGWLWWQGPTWTWRDEQPLAPWPLRLAISVVLVVLPLLVWTWLVHRRQRRLQREREQQAQRVQDPCLVYLQAQERSLENNLARVRDNHQGRSLHQIPWYLVLGEENAGKSSFISRSSQSFALTRTARSGAAQVAADPDLAFDIDWWIGDEAVLIDPPGEFISQPERQSPPTPAPAAPTENAAADTDAIAEPVITQVEQPTGLPAGAEKRLWHHMIDWLARSRSRRPLNGVVLLVDMVSLFERPPNERRNLAYLLRARLNELGHELGTRLPLYVVLSKFDLLDGFEELFAKLPASAREEVQGFTFSLDAVEDFDAWLGELTVAYDRFVDALNMKVMLAMGDPGPADARERLFCLMRQLSGSREILLRFLGDVLGSDRYTTPALVRGVYLSSVYQRGVVSNLFVEASARAYGFPAPVSSTKPQGHSVVYFAQHLLQRVVYPEAGLAGDNFKVARRKRRLLLSGSVLAGISGALLVGGWWYYYGINRDKADQVLAQSQAFSSKASDLQADPTGLNLLVPLDEIRDAVTVYGDYRATWPQLADMGLYQGQLIGPMVDQAYLSLLSRRFLPAIAEGAIEVIRRAEPGSDEQLAALRVYRMIEDRDNRRPEIVVQWMAQQWQQAYPGQGQRQAALMRHLTYALAYADVELPEHRALIAQTQQQLRKLPMAQRVYMTLRQQAQERLHGELDLRNEIGPAFDVVYRPLNERYSGAALDENLALPPLLTARGFRDYFEPNSQNVTELALIDQWVLGERRSLDYSEADRRVLTERLRALYSADYVDSWRRALNQFAVTDFTDLAQTLEVLGQVTGPAAPLRRLLETVRDNTLIYPLPIGKDEVAPVDERGRTQALGIHRAFAGLSGLLNAEQDKPSYYEETLRAINAVYDYVKSVQDQPSPGKAALGVVLTRFSQTNPDPIRNLQRIASGLPEPLNRHVNQLAVQSSQMLTITALRELEKRWDSEIYSFYRDRLAGRYPFKASGEDASLQDFVAFFGPKGRLQQFQDQYLNVFLKDNLDSLSAGDQGGHWVRQEVLEQLEKAERIRETFFSPDGQLAVQLTIEPLALSATRLSSMFSVDGQLISYQHGAPQRTGLVWPNTLGNSNGSQLTLVHSTGNTASLSYRGPWSLFRLLSRGHLNGRTDTSVDLTFTVADGLMRYRIGAEKANNPITQRSFEGFALPRTLLEERGRKEVTDSLTRR
ncbi:type VI secretion system membrane subunit TssM [Pseudomonas synxantha]|uniref:Type VI secretion system membrane subunit TssM n=1 Tax=Pseudomonas synxantha TaxID=47883 RepID=A0ABS0UD89_9PSED|nr:type VI secretion system membrane subunit TssM [Pseudomonas synxantha]MBI6563540.1 type VI secretion system membrane subunit TssM [Pseudomonas synxantha]MBI6581262.1 type VI secretion system membrane subunit TssM [Pseudomonas synxantha]MBI6646578.1 type VI secretion system membrane subunit TssM [Pseudomonas synxantha]